MAADGFQILRARGVQSEAELPFAALLELCRPILTLLEQLEPAQAYALRATFVRGKRRYTVMLTTPTLMPALEIAPAARFAAAAAR